MLRAAAHVGFEPKRRSIDTVSFKVMMAAVAEGLGVAILPQMALIDEHPGVVAYPLLDVPLRRRIFAASREGARDIPAIAAVLGALRVHGAKTAEALPEVSRK